MHRKNYSDDYATLIDDEVKNILIECENQCEGILREHFDKLELVAETLLKTEKIDAETFLKLMADDYVPEADSEEENASSAETEVSAAEASAEEVAESEPDDSAEQSDSDGN